MKSGFIYIISNKNRTTFYVGVTSGLKERITKHKNGIGSAFACQYKLTDLIYFESFPNISDAIIHEKQLKNWHRKWKFDLIKSKNPDMEALYWDL